MSFDEYSVRELKSVLHGLGIVLMGLAVLNPESALLLVIASIVFFLIGSGVELYIDAKHK